MPDEDDIHPIPEKGADDTADAADSGRSKRRRRITPPAAPAEARQIRRSQIAVNVIAQIVLVFVLFGIINYFNFRHHKRWDLTENKKYTVSSETAGFLASLDKDVSITMAFLSSSKIHQNLKALLEEYRRLSNGKISLSVFDPARDRNKATEVSQKYKLLLETSTVLIDVGGSVKTITEDEMIEEDGRLFRGEDALTSALIAATESGKKRVYLVTGHGQLRRYNERTALNELRDLSSNQFFEVETLSLSDVQEIPADADALVVIGATLDFSEREMEMIRGFWEGDNGALMLMLSPEGAQSRTPNLNAFLASYGISPQPDRVMEATGAGLKTFDVQGTFLPGSPINRTLERSTTTFFGETCTLKVLEDSQELIKRGLGIVALVQANPRFWGEYEFTAENPVLDPTDNKAPVFVAASVEKGATEDLRLKLETSRMVVISNSGLLDADRLTASNVSFILSGLNWILDRERLIGIPAKTATAYRIEITESQHVRMFRLAIFVLPGIAFALAFMVWSIRRA